MGSRSKATVLLEDPSELVVLDNPALPDTGRVVLIGQANVGKSVVFSRLTSRYVTISNFPGTTVEIFHGRVNLDGETVEIIDTPGINSTYASTEDERAALRVLQEDSPELIVQVADAKNMRRTLRLTAQLAQFGIPMVLTLNMMDECERKGIYVDADILSKKLGIPVVQTVATTGAGLDGLKKVLRSRQRCSLNGHEPFQWVEDALASAQRSTPGEAQKLETRTKWFTFLALFGSLLHLENYFGAWLGLPTLATSFQSFFETQGFSEILTETLTVILAYLLPVLVPVLWAIGKDHGFNERFGVWARQVLPGTLILVVTMSLVFQLVGVLGAQTLVGILEEGIFSGYVTPFLQDILPSGFLNDLVVGQYGVVSMGIAYAVAIVLPVVSTFFIAFSFLEDSGYLPRLSILSDRLLRAMGLHGKALLPMVLGLGCVTMATMTTRILRSKKERFVATFLLALGVPCSAQLGVILGITSGISLKALLIVFGTVASQLVFVGFVLSKLYPGQRSSFVLEVPPIRYPDWKNIFRKTYWRVVWFLKEALPLFAIGALALFVLDKLQLLGKITSASEPVITGLLGLPKEAAAVFLVGFLRRDYGAAGLFDLSRQGQLDSIQIVVGLVVLTLFVPCIANSLVIVKEQGLWKALGMIAFVFVYAVCVGGVLNWLLHTFGIVL